MYSRHEHQHGHQQQHQNQHQHQHQHQHGHTSHHHPHHHGHADNWAYSGYNGYGGYYTGNSRGAVFGVFGASILFIVVLVVILSLNFSTFALSASAAHMTAVGAATGGAFAFSAATFGIGAALIYGLAGLGYLYSAAKECFNEDKNVLDMIKSRVVNEDGLSFKGIMKSIGAVLWSPFLLLGGAAGMAVRAGVNAYKGSTASKSPENEDSLGYGGGSSLEMSQTLGVQSRKERTNGSVPDQAPKGTSKSMLSPPKTTGPGTDALGVEEDSSLTNSN